MLRFLVCVCGSYMDVVRSPLANVFGLTLGPVLPRHFQDWHSSAQNIDSQRNANVHGKVGRATRRRDIVSRPRLLNLLGHYRSCPYLTRGPSNSGENPTRRNGSRNSVRRDETRRRLLNGTWSMCTLSSSHSLRRARRRPVARSHPLDLVTIQFLPACEGAEPGIPWQVLRWPATCFPQDVLSTNGGFEYTTQSC